MKRKGENEKEGVEQMGVFAALVAAEHADGVVELVRRSIRSKRELIVHAIVERLRGTGGAPVPPTANREGGEWTGVESLSRLRSIVGGRFQNIKDRWIGAGLPLKEHRGERSKLGKIDQAGWLELSSWVQRQGFEVRLASDRDDILFEIRPSSTDDKR